MAQSKRQIEAVLASAGSRPRHRFGQNFMIDANLVRAVAEAGAIRPGDLVIEVGPGTGTLTEELLARAQEDGRVLAVEIDRDLAAALRTRFAPEARLTLIEGDALSGKHALDPRLAQAIEAARGEARPARLVANLPYHIASPLVVELLLAGVDVLAFTVQKEVAMRLRASPAEGKDYGPLSIVVQSLADVEVLRTIPAEAFWPRPQVESSLVRLRRHETDEAIRGREREFARFVTGLFSMRRKTVRKGLATATGDVAAALACAGLSGEERPEEIDPPQMRALFACIRNERP